MYEFVSMPKNIMFCIIFVFFSQNNVKYVYGYTYTFNLILLSRLTNIVQPQSILQNNKDYLHII